MKVASITDPTTADGLKLAGVGEAYEAPSAEKAESIYKEVLEEEEIGIVIITEQLAQDMSQKVLDSREEKEGILPIVIEIPGKEGPVPERREFIDNLVKRAVGIKIEE